jgi:hypothetical protein
MKINFTTIASGKDTANLILEKQSVPFTVPKDKPVACEIMDDDGNWIPVDAFKVRLSYEV